MTRITEPQNVPFVTRAEAKASGLKKYAAPSECRHGPITIRYTSIGSCVACQRESHAAWKAANPGAAEAANAAWKLANPGAAVASTRRWQKAHPEKVAEYETRRDKDKRRANQRAAHARDPAKSNAKSALWRRKNPETANAIHARWHLANPGKRAQYQAIMADRHAVSLRAKRSAWKKANPEYVIADRHLRRARTKGAEGHFSVAEIRALFAAQDGKCAYCKIPITLQQKQPNTAHRDHIVSLARGGSNWISNIALSCDDCNWRKSAKDAEDFIREMAERRKLLTR